MEVPRFRLTGLGGVEVEVLKCWTYFGSASNAVLDLAVMTHNS